MRSESFNEKVLDCGFRLNVTLKICPKFLELRWILVTDDDRFGCKPMFERIPT